MYVFLMSPELTKNFKILYLVEKLEIFVERKKVSYFQKICYQIIWQFV